MAREYTVTYFIETKFPAAAESPSGLFYGIGRLTQTLYDIDLLLLRSLDPEVEAIQKLDRLELGSLRTWFTENLFFPDQRQLGSEDPDPEELDAYLTEGRADLLQAMNGDINEPSQMDAIAKKIEEGADSRALISPSFTKPSLLSIAERMDDIQKGLLALPKSSTVAYGSAAGKALSLPSASSVDVSSIREKLTKETIKNTATVILLVKKPDFIGNSRWLFKHGTTAIEARVLDEDWMSSFRGRTLELKPGDYVRVTMDTYTSYDARGAVLSLHREIVAVHEVLAPEENHELGL